MAYNEYSGVDKMYDHQGNLEPNVELSEGIRPAGEFRIAPWLPTANAQYDKKFEIWRILAAGKIVAMTCDGWVVPAGLAVKFRDAADSDVVLQYTSSDADRYVISLVTGALVAATDTTVNSGNGWTKGHVTTALRTRGIIPNDADADDYISAPVGVAPYGYLKAFDTNSNKLRYLRNPKNLAEYNFNMQSQIAILCDYVLELPWVPEGLTTVAGNVLGTVTAGTSTQNGLWWIAATNTTVLPMAQDSERLAYTFGSDSVSLFATRKNSVRAIRSTGDYLVDADMNRIYFYHGGASTAAVSSNATAVSYGIYHYNSVTDTGIDSNDYACVVGEVCPGKYLKPTVNSNWIPVTYADHRFTITDTVGTAFDQTELQGQLTEVQSAIRENALVIGQVLEVKHHPRGGLERVRSYGEHISWSSSQRNDRLPGNATAGMPNSITYANGANKTVTVNIIRK